MRIYTLPFSTEARRDMHDDRTDRIAREAARLMETGRVESIDAAVRRATEILKCHGAPLPTHGRVRRHAQAMNMQAKGDVAYAHAVREVLGIAAEIMTLLTEILPGTAGRSNRGVECVLVGRGANGLIDADPTLHIRAYCDLAIHQLADVLVEQGYEEPAFETIETRYGRLNRIRFSENDVEVVITRCVPPMMRDVQLDLLTGKRVATVGLEALRRRLGESG